MVNVMDLMRLQPASEHPHGMTDAGFDALFTTDRPAIFAYHGYPWLIHRLTYRRAGHDQFHVRVHGGSRFTGPVVIDEGVTAAIGGLADLAPLHQPRALAGAVPAGKLRVVTCHLGAGSSLAAVHGGRCADTTMGFTPLEGLVMATRCGSVDPG